MDEPTSNEYRRKIVELLHDLWAPRLMAIGLTFEQAKAYVAGVSGAVVALGAKWETEEVVELSIAEFERTRGRGKA